MHDQSEMLNCFNENFVSAGLMFDSVPPVSVKSHVDEHVTHVW